MKQTNKNSLHKTSLHSSEALLIKNRRKAIRHQKVSAIAAFSFIKIFLLIFTITSRSQYCMHPYKKCVLAGQEVLNYLAWI